MHPKAIDPVQRRNALLLIAAALMVLAIMQRPALLFFFNSASIVGSLAFSAIVALAMARALRHIALSFLPGPGDPWYAKPGALVFLAIGLFGLNAILTLMDRSGFMADPVGPVFHQPGMRFQIMAFEVLWLVLLEWVSYDNE